jgi:DNA-directed RNA polymerase specialized sigma24 family protein
MISTTPHQPTRVPSHEELLACLRQRLKIVERRLVNMGFPKHVAQEATDRAEIAADDAIWSGLAQSMTEPARGRWLWVVARNAAATMTRPKKRRKRTVQLPDGDVLSPRPAAWFDPDDPELAHQAVSRLPTDLRAVIEAMYLDLLNSRETAARLKIPETTVRRRREKGIELLQDIYQQLSKERWNRRGA